jgi:divalent metal cation (Fe/Co/Zn/Cd) transporter
MKSLLIGEAASPVAEQRIRDAIADGPEVRRIISLRTRHLGPDEVLVAAKLDLSSDTVPALARAIDSVEARVRESVPTAKLIFLEPDVYRPPDTATQEGQNT